MSSLFSASEIGPTRSRASYPHLLKTLFNDSEHLPEPVTCTGPLHVLGLVFLYALETCSPPARLTALMSRFQLRYPINFVVKHPVPPAFAERPSPEALETCPLPHFCRADLLLGCRHVSMAAIRKQRMRRFPPSQMLPPSQTGLPSRCPPSGRRLVELTGIEPVTSCLQSTRSPS